MGFFNRNKRDGGFMDEIRCDEPSYLIWKWHPAGVQTEEGNRENAIRWGSSLRVKEGEVAVFVYSDNDRPVQEFIEGPCDKIIDTKNLPIIASLVGLAYEGGTPFQAEVYFINLAQIIQVRFAVPFFDVYDPRFLDFGVPIAIRGTISFKISNYQEFIKLHRLIDFDLDDFEHQIRDVVIRYVKDCITNAPASHNIPVIQIETKISQINDIIEYDLSERLRENFGIKVSGLDIRSIEIDKSSEGYRQLMAVTKDVVSAKIEAETLDYVERLRIQREEGQYAIHKQTQSANIGAFQVEKQAEVGVAGAEALEHMGSNGAGNMGGNGGGHGFDMAAMMASMAVGGAVGQNIAGTMNNMMGGVSQPTQQTTTPPPVPQALYHVAVNGIATGPYDKATLEQMALSMKLTSETLVWTAGMENWEIAGNVEDLKNIFTKIPPVPPMK